jgi:hypothetical protein
MAETHVMLLPCPNAMPCVAGKKCKKKSYQNDIEEKILAVESGRHAVCVVLMGEKAPATSGASWHNYYPWQMQCC